MALANHQVFIDYATIKEALGIELPTIDGYPPMVDFDYNGMEQTLTIIAQWEEPQLAVTKSYSFMEMSTMHNKTVVLVKSFILYAALSLSDHGLVEE